MLLRLDIGSENVYQMIYFRYSYGFKVNTLEFNEGCKLHYDAYVDKNLSIQIATELFQFIDSLFGQSATETSLNHILKDVILTINKYAGQVYILKEDEDEIKLNYSE